MVTINGDKLEGYIRDYNKLELTLPWINKSPSLENPAGISSSFLSGKKKKIHIPVKNVLPSIRNCQKPNCRQNPSDKNPLTALIQFLKEISGWKVTEKPDLWF